MKKIKKIVLRSATKLTNSEMKKLRGGYDPIYSPSCRVECPVGSASLDCSKHELKDLFCAPISGAGFYGVGCYNGYDSVPYPVELCPPEPVPAKNKGNNDI